MWQKKSDVVNVLKYLPGETQRTFSNDDTSICNDDNSICLDLSRGTDQYLFYFEYIWSHPFDVMDIPRRSLMKIRLEITFITFYFSSKFHRSIISTHFLVVSSRPLQLYASTAVFRFCLSRRWETCSFSLSHSKLERGFARWWIVVLFCQFCHLQKFLVPTTTRGYQRGCARTFSTLFLNLFCYVFHVFDLSILMSHVTCTRPLWQAILCFDDDFSSFRRSCEYFVVSRYSYVVDCYTIFFKMNRFC